MAASRREARLDAEQRLRDGKLKVLVATASLELGIDIGHVDLVCQICRTDRDLPAAGRRSGHTIKGVPKGRIFPLTRDDLIECAAMVRAVHDGVLDQVSVPDKPLDVLAQQVVAEVSAEEEWDEGALFSLSRPRIYRNLEKARFDEVVEMLARGYAPGAAGAARCFTTTLSTRSSGAKGQPPQRDRERRRDSGGVRLPGAARARRPLHRHAERGLRDRIAAGRRVPARQHLVAHPAHRQRRGARRRRARPAAFDAVLARRGAGAQRRR